jgi:hypothetical protein
VVVYTTVIMQDANQWEGEIGADFNSGGKRLV